MSWFRAPLRLSEDPQHSGTALASALREWGADAADAHAVARLERQLTAAMLEARSAPARRQSIAPRAPACLFGLWAMNVAIALLISSYEVPREARPPQHTGLSAVEVASRLGVGPRELAAFAAVDPWHVAR